MSTERIHIVLPCELVAAIDHIAGKRGRSRFITEAAWQEVKRREQLEALERAAGCWRDEDHPELKRGAARWVRHLRGGSGKRFRNLPRG